MSDGLEVFSRGCVVVVFVQDGISFNIYYYGGYVVFEQKLGYLDVVWVLLFFFFMWIKFIEGIGFGCVVYKCIKLYFDQMMVIGGYFLLDVINIVLCFQELIWIYNLFFGMWVNCYDLVIWSNYIVFQGICDIIGGFFIGDVELMKLNFFFVSIVFVSVFVMRYDNIKINVYYLYVCEVQVNNINLIGFLVIFEEV